MLELGGNLPYTWTGTSRYFWPIFTPPVTLRHTSRAPPKVRHTSRTSPFLEGLVQKTLTKAPLYNSVSIVRGVFILGFCQDFFCREGFVRGGCCPLPFCQNTSVTSES